MFLELDVSFIFPSNCSVSRRPLPSTGSFGSVPPLPRYYETLGLPVVRQASLRCLRSALPPRCPLLRSPPRRALRCEAWAWSVALRLLGVETPRVSQVPGEPTRSHAPLFDPGGPGARLFRRYGFAFRLIVRRRLPPLLPAEDSHDIRHFVALSRGLLARCLRFAARITPGPRKTRFRLGASLGRAATLMPVVRWDPS